MLNSKLTTYVVTVISSPMLAPCSKLISTVGTANYVLDWLVNNGLFPVALHVALPDLHIIYYGIVVVLLCLNN